MSGARDMVPMQDARRDSVGEVGEVALDGVLDDAIDTVVDGIRGLGSAEGDFDHEAVEGTFAQAAGRCRSGGRCARAS